MSACFQKEYATLDRLIEAGAGVKTISSNGYTALDYIIV